MTFVEVIQGLEEGGYQVRGEELDSASEDTSPDRAEPGGRGTISDPDILQLSIAMNHAPKDPLDPLARDTVEVHDASVVVRNLAQDRVDTRDSTAHVIGRFGAR